MNSRLKWIPQALIQIDSWLKYFPHFSIQINSIFRRKAFDSDSIMIRLWVIPMFGHWAKMCSGTARHFQATSQINSKNPIMLEIGMFIESSALKNHCIHTTDNSDDPEHVKRSTICQCWWGYTPIERWWAEGRYYIHTIMRHSSHSKTKGVIAYRVRTILRSRTSADLFRLASYKNAASSETVLPHPCPVFMLWIACYIDI